MKNLLSVLGKSWIFKSQTFQMLLGKCWKMIGELGEYNLSKDCLQFRSVAERTLFSSIQVFFSLLAFEFGSRRVLVSLCWIMLGTSGKHSILAKNMLH